ncbi:MAG: Rieske (2Fe-2S) protein [Microbacterium sp.]|uniref:Rieske (2Fe-2S) protein n=1 Tax=Microbacterium sp. TaxID=51671 RepID=UPI002721F6AA|nr:Rieske (2Fe-2S) protein [Microbacterium sp.]MDO8383594.1 Rieske (2Fe-2S) protein [Microbacterium sp.]
MSDATMTDAARASLPAPAPVWYPLVELARVTASAPLPVPVSLDGVPWAIVILDGKAAALYDVCPHRRVPLSAGRVTEGPGGDVLECGYHGWSYDRQGACARIPALGEGVVPRGMGSVAVLRTDVFAGVVWGTRSDVADFSPVADNVIALKEQPLQLSVARIDEVLGGEVDEYDTVRRGVDTHGRFSYAVRPIDAARSALFPLATADALADELSAWITRLSLLSESFPDTPLSASTERSRDAR